MLSDHLQQNGDNWSRSTPYGTEVWVWGPLEISDEEGPRRLVVADDQDRMVDLSSPPQAIC
jgi:hypothetical protein